ncbi:MAG: CRTAC1 family protein [Pirellulaceae bacterium]|nr:CRTAC1 family protein [Pirellulaceae bacterium]
MEDPASKLDPLEARKPVSPPAGPASSSPQSAPPEPEDDAVIGRALKWSLGVLAALALLAGLVACVLYLPGWLSRFGQPEEAAEVELPRLREVPRAEVPTVRFTEITAQAGIDFVQENGAQGEKLLPETMGGGCAFLDYDNDGDQDLLLVGSARWPWDPRGPSERSSLALYRNDGRGQFEEVTDQQGLHTNLYAMGVAVGDFDNDGFTDLFISAVGRNRLYRNTGQGFEDVTELAGVGGDEDRWSTGCGWVDYNRDGRLDLVVVNYVRWSREIDLAQNFQLVGVGRAYGPPVSFEGSFPYLYRNDGDGKFTDVTAEAGLQVRNPDTGVPLAKSLGLAPVDLDSDGWIDLVVANDTVQNLVFHNQANGTFREIGKLCGIAFDMAGQARGAMGIDTAHLPGYDALGVAIGNFANEMTALYVAQGDPLQFTDAAIATGLGPATRLELTFGVFFFDYDLDGRLDLLGANGHLEEEINKGQPSQHYQQPPQLFWNAGPDQPTMFVRVPEDRCGADFCAPLVGRGAAYADIDGDADLDVLLMASGGRPRLLRNDQQLGHHWIRLQFPGGAMRRQPIGAWIEVHAGGNVLRRQVMPTRSYLSQVELPVTIGLGGATSVERMTIRWPEGHVQTIPQPPVDQVLVVE